MKNTIDSYEILNSKVQNEALIEIIYFIFQNKIREDKNEINICEANTNIVEQFRLLLEKEKEKEDKNKNTSIEKAISIMSEKINLIIGSSLDFSKIVSRRVERIIEKSKNKQKDKIEHYIDLIKSSNKKYKVTDKQFEDLFLELYYQNKKLVENNKKVKNYLKLIGGNKSEKYQKFLDYLKERDSDNIGIRLLKNTLKILEEEKLYFYVLKGKKMTNTYIETIKEQILYIDEEKTKKGKEKKVKDENIIRNMAIVNGKNIDFKGIEFLISKTLIKEIEDFLEEIEDLGSIKKRINTSLNYKTLYAQIFKVYKIAKKDGRKEKIKNLEEAFMHIYVNNIYNRNNKSKEPKEVRAKLDTYFEKFYNT